MSMSMLMHLPDDVWSLIFTQLCYAVPTADLLHVRLVCKRWSHLITSEHVAYHAVVAANRHILLSNHGTYPRPSDLPISWWSFLLDQVRLDRTWIVGTQLPKLDHGHFINTRWEPHVRSDPYSLLRHTRNDAIEDLIAPGNEAIVLTHAPTGEEDTLLYYDWTCTDIRDLPGPDGVNAEIGTIGYLAFREHPRCGRFIVVHLLEYPSLTPLATHIVQHEGLGSTSTELELPLNGPDGRPLAVEPIDPAEFLSVALCHVDHGRKTYLLSFTDYNDHSVLILRSFEGPNSGGESGTIASFAYSGRCTTSIVRPSDDPNHYRLLVVDAATLHTCNYSLSADTLTPTGPPAILSDDTYMCDYFPHLHRGLTVIANGIGDISLWDAQSSALTDWFPATPDGRPVRVPLLRPFIRPHLLAEQPISRPNASSSTPLHEQREWTQLLVGYVDTPLDFEELEPLRGCKMALVTLPREPNANLAQLVSDQREPRIRPEQKLGYLNTFLGPSFMAGEIIGHLLFVLQYDGSVVVVDLRETDCVAGKRRKLFDLHRRAMQQWIGDKDVGQEPRHQGPSDKPHVYPLRTHHITGEQVRGAPNDLMLPEWAERMANSYAAGTDQSVDSASATSSSIAPLLQSLIDHPSISVPPTASAPGPESPVGAVQSPPIDYNNDGEGDQAWVSEYENEDDDDAEYLPPVAELFGGLMGEQHQDLLLDDQLDAMMPSEEDINLSCAGDIMLLGERGNALLVHYGKSIAVLRRRRSLA